MTPSKPRSVARSRTPSVSSAASSPAEAQETFHPAFCIAHRSFCDCSVPRPAAALVPPGVSARALDSVTDHLLDQRPPGDAEQLRRTGLIPGRLGKGLEDLRPLELLELALELRRGRTHRNTHGHLLVLD